MELTRTEILPGVWLNALHTEKFKTACLSLSLLTQLTRETASMNALIPYVLRRGTTRYPDMEALSARMDELYGAAVEPVVRRIGEIQCLGFYASIPEGDFLPGGKGVLHEVCELLGSLLLSPATRGGLLLPQYVDSEKEKLLEAIRSRVNDKRSYALMRCVEEMCCYEDFAVGRLGSESACENINYKKLTRQYHSLLQQSPVEIFYCGRATEREVRACLRDALITLPRGEIDTEIGTDLRMNALEETPRFQEEALDVNQGQLCIGWRLGECMEDPDLASLLVFNAVFGAGTSSKLFQNVREKLQLDAARDEIFSQLDSMKRGEISAEELAAAKAGIASDLRAMTDSQGELEGFLLSQTLDGLDYGPLELAALVEEVTAEEISAIARSTECDQIYFLKKDEEETEEQEQDGE